MARTAILLMAFGGPASLDEVGTFMARLMGRAPAPQIVERVIERYRLIGGGSPLRQITLQQAKALERRLSGEGAPRVRAAFKYGEPSITSSVYELAHAGCPRILGISLSAHYTRVSTGAYVDELLAAGEQHGVEVVVAESFHVEPHFLDGIAEQLRTAMSLLSDPGDAYVIFSAHSIPVEHVETGDPYVEQLQATVKGVVQRVSGHDWRLAYQSRGMGQGRWLEPSVETVLEEVATLGRRRVALAPIGFTAEHVETLYDIDLAIAGRAKELGLEFARASTLNASDPLIEALAAVACPHIDGGAPGQKRMTH